MVSERKPKTKKDNTKKKRGPKTYPGTAAPKGDKNNSSNDIPLVSDPRFAAQHWDPRFGRIPSKASSAAATEVTDERFSSALKSDRFRTTTSRVDRFGRPIRRKKPANRLKKDADDDDDDEEDEYCEPTAAELSSDSEDSSDDDSEADNDSDAQVDDAPGSTQQYGSATKRLAVQSLDWTKTRAVDIYACFSSFLSGRTALKKVSVYPSKLGLKRLAAEARLGPAFVSKVDQEMLKKAQDDGLDVTEDNASGSDVSDSESDDEVVDKEVEERRAQRRLRKYEEERLNYFYAVAEFTDASAANVIYEQCDGVEYSQSRCVFNLSFVPVDMNIEATPREVCEKLPDGYKPPNVAPSTLSNSTVQMTWDADAPDRFVLRRSALGRHEEDEENLKAYLASASEDDSDEEGKKESKEDIERKRKLLLGIGGDDGNGEEEDEAAEEEEEEMVVNFDPGMFEKGQDIVNAHEEKLQRADETPWEGRMRRMEERKAEKKRKRQERFHQGDDNGEEMEGESAATFDDPFFKSEGGSDFKRAQRQAAKKRRRETVTLSTEEQEAKERQAAELELLMGSDGKKEGMKDALAQAESDDDDDRMNRREMKKKKRTRGRRRADKERAASQKAKIEKPSVLDTNDERFQGLFNSHLFALDPTHPKFKRDETTEKIMNEKRKRGDRMDGGNSNGEEKKKRANNEMERSIGKDGVMQLAAKIKAQSKRKSFED